MIIAEMQQSAGPHTGENSPILDGSAHAGSTTAMRRPITRYAGTNSQSSHRITEKPSTKNNPTGSIFSNRLPQRGGSNPAKTLPPSSGGTGNKLKSANTTLTQMPASAISAIQLIKVSLRLTRTTAAKIPHQTAAMAKLAAGPARATITMARRGLRSMLVATGTGFAQPKSGPPTARRTPGTSTVPTGSICRSGLRLKRPSICAVRSPKIRAVHPCATSCSVIAKSAGIAHIEIFSRNADKSNACTRYLTINTSSRARIASALYGCWVRKGGDVAAAHPDDDGAVARQIDHRCRNQSAVAAIQDEIDGVLEPLVDLLRIGPRQVLPRQ